MSATQRETLKMWWSGGWHEGRALALAIGILTTFQGFATLYTPSLIFYYYGFLSPAVNLISPTLFGVMAIYVGVALAFSRSGRFRYGLLIFTAMMWGYIAYGFINDSLYPIITAAPPLATITISLVALVRARAWLRR
jgi:hypothetical protein